MTDLTESMLNEIRARLAKRYMVTLHDGPAQYCETSAALVHIAALIAEVDRLRAGRARKKDAPARLMTDDEIEKDTTLLGGHPCHD